MCLFFSHRIILLIALSFRDIAGVFSIENIQICRFLLIVQQVDLSLSIAEHTNPNTRTFGLHFAPYWNILLASRRASQHGTSRRGHRRHGHLILCDKRLKIQNSSSSHIHHRPCAATSTGIKAATSNSGCILKCRHVQKQRMLQQTHRQEFHPSTDRGE